MILPKSCPRVRPGDAMQAKWANDIAAAIDRNQVLIGDANYGLNALQTDSGLIIWSDPPRVGGCMKVDSSGITAFNATTKALGTGTVRIWNINTNTFILVDSGVDLVVYNNTLDAVPANKWGQYKYIDGVPFVDVASCT